MEKQGAHEVQETKEHRADVPNKNVDIGWIVVGLAGLAILLVLRRKKAPAMPEASAEEEIAQAIDVLERPRQMYPGRWFRHTIKMVECDPPPNARPAPHIVDSRQMQRR